MAHFAGFSKTNIGKERLNGFLEALSKNKISINKDWIIEGGFELKDGYGSFKKLNSLGNLPEVIFAVNDRVALGAYEAAKEAGLNISDDIGIFGYGFNEITDFFDPQLTVINQDPRKMCREAIRLLIDEIENNTKGGHRKIFIEEEFLWRKSVKLKVKKQAQNDLFPKGNFKYNNHLVTSNFFKSDFTRLFDKIIEEMINYGKKIIIFTFLSNRESYRVSKY